MKKALLSMVFSLSWLCAHAGELEDRVSAVPNPRVLDSGWVSDPANVIARRKSDINALISELERSNATEIAVAVLPTIGSLSPKEFAVALFAKWGVGKATHDNGVLVLHVLDQRRIEIETGYGMEGILPDAKCHWITEEIAVPFFKRGSFADGHYEIVRALIRGVRNPSITHVDLIEGWTVQPGDAVDRIPSSAQTQFAVERATPSLSSAATWIAASLCAVGFIIFAWATLSYRSRAQFASPHERYELYSRGKTKLQYLAPLPIAAAAGVAEFARTGTPFSGVLTLVGGLLGLYFLRKRKLSALREAPRTCVCGQPMQKQNESDDDRFLQQGNIAEESIYSMDYDVWLCSCGKFSIESYSGKSFAKTCPKCSYKTFRNTDSRIVVPATTMSTGIKEITYACANCKHTKVATHIIPVVSTSHSSSGSSSGGHSGGSSFGGGRSGGGGAGSSY